VSASNLNKLPSKNLGLLSELVDIVHLGAVFETTNQIDWLHSCLISLEREKREIVSGSGQRLSILLFLLSGRDSGETEIFQINQVDGVTCLDTNNTSIDNKLLICFLND
jgi:hypothetical protein